MKTISTALTRPRSASGVASAVIIERMFMLIMSAKPLTASAANESANECESPNTTMLPPKTPTTTSSLRPAMPRSGRRVSMIPARRAPTAGALRSTPSPTGPTSRMSRANSGSSATAPPKSTATRSSEIAPSSTGVRRTNRSPASSEPSLVPRIAAGACSTVRGLIVTAIAAATSMSTAPAA